MSEKNELETIENEIMHVPPPVDRSAVATLQGTAPHSAEQLEVDPKTGMHKDYVVLSDAERAKGFVRPVRRSYKHVKPNVPLEEQCRAVTTMSQPLAETYARDPKFYSGTYCGRCKAHFPVGENGEFYWVEDDRPDCATALKVGT